MDTANLSMSHLNGRRAKKEGKFRSLKEMKYRPKIGQGDLDTKTTKVEVSLRGHKSNHDHVPRKRSLHPELGREILERVAEQSKQWKS